MPGLTWPGRGPTGAKKFRGPQEAQAFAQVLGNALNPNQAPSVAPTGFPPIEAIYLLSLPNVDSDNYGFNTSTPDGAFHFVFKWLDAEWNCWVTMPDGSVRPAGCIPLVFNWTGWLDFSTVIVSSLVVLGHGDLSGATMFLVKWKT
jgi:hypothetical protein